MNRAEAQAQITQALIDSLRDRANVGFTLSQNVVPVVSSALKNSGSITEIPNGSMISYKMPYASIVERGIEDHIETIPAYSRKGRYVRSHTRHMNAKEGVHYIEKSLKQAFETFSNTIDMYLRVKFTRVERR